jgi:hypothetical protein
MTEPKPAASPPSGCPRCAHRRWWLPFVLVRIHGINFATRCSCARGAWLSALDQERERRRLHPARQLHQELDSSQQQPAGDQ